MWSKVELLYDTVHDLVVGDAIDVNPIAQFDNVVVNILKRFPIEICKVELAGILTLFIVKLRTYVTAG